jgi:AmiR/NasT family two-component response regulator
MATRAVIDQAKGIVMGRQGVTADEAFTLITRMSQNRNLKVRDIAAQIVRESLRAPSSTTIAAASQ